MADDGYYRKPGFFRFTRLPVPDRGRWNCAHVFRCFQGKAQETEGRVLDVASPVQHVEESKAPKVEAPKEIKPWKEVFDAKCLLFDEGS